jgi:hypothetical protein
MPSLITLSHGAELLRHPDHAEAALTDLLEQLVAVDHVARLGAWGGGTSVRSTGHRRRRSDPAQHPGAFTGLEGSRGSIVREQREDLTLQVPVSLAMGVHVEFALCFGLLERLSEQGQGTLVERVVHRSVVSSHDPVGWAAWSREHRAESAMPSGG